MPQSVEKTSQGLLLKGDTTLCAYSIDIKKAGSGRSLRLVDERGQQVGSAVIVVKPPPPPPEPRPAMLDGGCGCDPPLL